MASIDEEVTIRVWGVLLLFAFIAGCITAGSCYHRRMDHEDAWHSKQQEACYEWLEAE